MLALTNRNAGTGDSRFVDLKKGELARADFAEGSCTDEIKVNVRARREQGGTVVAETDAVLRSRLDVKGEIPAQGDLRAKPAQGTIIQGATIAGGVSQQNIPSYTSVLQPGQAPLNANNSNSPTVPINVATLGSANALPARPSMHWSFPCILHGCSQLSTFPDVT